MAHEVKSVTITPLTGSNYSTWKVQCRMALMKDCLWSIVSGEEPPPAEGTEGYVKYVIRRNRALAIIVLSVDTSLLYLLGDPEDPVIVWNKLADQFQKKTWANKLSLRRRLNNLQLKEGNSISSHIKTMTEIFHDLAVIGAPMDEEDQVVTLLASLPDCFNTLVTALEANDNVPKMEIATERLLHEERKINDRGQTSTPSTEKLLNAKSKGPRCHHCKKLGHIKRNCRFLNQNYQPSNQGRFNTIKYKANNAETRPMNSDGIEKESMYHALPAGNITENSNAWIVDSGASCHMCHNKGMFTNFTNLKKEIEVALGDGRLMKATGIGVILLKMRINGNTTEICKLSDVLYVPDLTINLLSVSKVVNAGNVTLFTETGCKIINRNQQVIARAYKVGNLYYINYVEDTYIVSVSGSQDKKNLWHLRYGHLGQQNLKKLAIGKMVLGFDFNIDGSIDFCDSCVYGKHHRMQFPKKSENRSSKPLELIHSDVCGKMNSVSLGGAEYFLSFVDDKTRYVWFYVIKSKDQVFDIFKEFRIFVENTFDFKIKTIRTDNGGEYCSTKFKDYLTNSGIRHELTVPKNPEQNGVSERLNRTLVEMIRSMLTNANLPQYFWAEALSTAVYLRNRSPTNSVQGMTPFESLMGRKPDVGNLRVFGCTAYAHIPKDERHKLDPKARKCIFLGYGLTTKAYRLYDLDKKKIIYSRDVIFNESN